jgi:Flp pilus assembly protein TadD
LGLCEVLSKRYREAVEVLEPLWDEKSNDVPYLYLLDIAAVESGQKELDEKILKQMIAVGGKTAEYHLILGKAFLNRYEVPEAKEELELAAAIDSNLPLLHLDLGITYMRLGQNDRAEAEIRKDIELYQKQRKLTEALKMADRALGLSPEIHGGHFLRGRILAQLGREKEAQVEFAAARKSMDTQLNRERNALEQEPVPNPELTKQPQ